MELHVDHLNFAYNRADVLSDINCQFRTGHFYSLIGPNGSGKSTLVRLLNRILKPRQGTVWLDGTSLENYRRKEIARLIGYVPQSGDRLAPLTVYDIIMLGRRPHLEWVPGGGDRQKVEEIINEFSLQHLALRHIHELSGGELQRVHIARALVQEPQILLLDEPTSSLDLRHQIEVMKLLRNISSKQGITVIMAIHDLNLALRYSDCFVLLKNGRILSMGGAEVITEQNLKQLYDVEIKKIDGNGHMYVVPLMD